MSDTENNDFGTNPVRDLYYQYGYLPQDARHVVKTTATYQLASWFSAGIVWRYFSGQPYSRLFQNGVLATFSDLRARRGINPGTNINDPSDDRPLRMPDIQEVNVQTRFNLKPLIGAKLELYADILNLFALRTSTTVLSQNDGPTFGQPGNRLGPFRLRLGLRYRH